MTTSAPTTEAIEAAARAICRETFVNGARFETLEDDGRKFLRDTATVALSAAYPLMVAQAKAEALREAAEVLEQLDRAGFCGTESGDYSDIRAVASGGTVDWLRARAATIAQDVTL